MATKMLLTLLSLLSIVAAAASNINGDKIRSIAGEAAMSDAESLIRLPAEDPENPESYIAMVPEEEEEEMESSSDGGNDLMVRSKPPPPKKGCDEYPQICRRKSSPGPDCCGKRCTNVMKDIFNCGKCERRCRHDELCCRGHCVNPSSDHRNCGKCGKRCKEWETCVYGMCSYA